MCCAARNSRHDRTAPTAASGTPEMRNDDNGSDFGLFIAAWLSAFLLLVVAMGVVVNVLK